MIASSNQMRIAFVIPWYGEIPGGAESACKNTAERLGKDGVKVEILTTCAKEFLSDWSLDYYEEGTYDEGGLKVRRFSLNPRNAIKFDQINTKLMNNRKVTPQEEELFIHEMINSDNLCHYIWENGDRYDFFIFIPYMFGTTYYGSQIHPHKSILIPCLHDESYAYMNIYKPMFKSINTLLFHAEPEKELFHKIFGDFGNHIVIGTGVDTHFDFNSDRFCEKFRINDPFILYAGRREPGKNTPLLLNYFTTYKQNTNSPLKLVFIGSGEVSIPSSMENEIFDLGFVSSQDKYDAYAAATIFCQPSINESFSLVIMDSWLCKTPVLVHGNCSVTKYHCIHSKGGLYFSDYDEFEETVNYLLKNENKRVKMGLNGKRYVEKMYSWDVIIKKYKDVLGALKDAN